MGIQALLQLKATKKMRRSVFILLLSLFGCYSSNGWEVAHVQAGNPDYDSARLSYHISDRVNGIGIEMIYARKQLHTYLEVHSQTIPPHQNNLQEALVKLTIGNEHHRSTAYRHAGGQRLSLPQDLQSMFIDALEHGEAVTIALEGYSATIQPENFSKIFSQFKSSPIKNPLRLPI